MVAANVGVEVWLQRSLIQTDAVDSTPPGEAVWIAQRLGYANVNGKWGLAVKAMRIHSGCFEGDTSCPYENEYVQNEPIPLAQASREARLAALQRLPDLIEALEDKAKEALKTIAAVTKLVV